jgi:hypothetical protein
MRLRTSTIKPGWSVPGVDSVPATTRLVTAYAGKNGQRTVVGLDTAGAQLNAASATVMTYTIGGLPAAGGCTSRSGPRLATGSSLRRVSSKLTRPGVVTIPVPQQAVFVLTSQRPPAT